MDERLTTVLATLAGAHRLEIGAFVAMPGEDVAGAPLRTVELASIDGRPIAAGDPAVVEVVASSGTSSRSSGRTRSAWSVAAAANHACASRSP